MRPGRVAVWMCGVVLAGMATLEASDGVVHGLMPAPVSVELPDGGFPLDPALTATVVGPPNARLERAMGRLVARLAVRTGRPLELELIDDPRRASLVVDCPGALARPFPSLGDDESYRLSVGAPGIRLEAPGPLGALRGLATLAQLAALEGDRWVLRAAEIEDAPRFAWRGLMIDAVRHWQPREVIERNLDAMEAVKLNVLHLHLTDDQGFRVESETYPLLHERGSDGNYFFQEDVEHLVAYAADRGIRVVPEFDVPGHVTSWFVAYPELGGHGEGPFELPGPGGGMFHNALDPTREETYTFLDGLFGEMAGLFPDEFFHVGGDEVTHDSWSDDGIEAFMEEHGLEGTRGLQAHFTKRVLEIVARHGKTAVGWDEMTRGEVREDTVIQMWLPGANPGSARSVVSGGFYLDHMLSAGTHHANEPLDALPSEAARANVIGGEACLWSEFVIPATIDSRIWPRAAAIAERLWSSREVGDVEDMHRRLALVRADLARLGLQHDSYYEPALARLTGGTVSPALKTLADVCGPPNVLERFFFSPGSVVTMLAPSLARRFVERPETGTRLEDVLQPESDVATAFEKAVDAYLESPDADSRRAVEEPLQRWRDNHDEFVTLFDEYPDLEEIEPVSQGLAELAELGLSALEVLDGERLFSPREKRLHRERLALHDPSPLDLREFEIPVGSEDEDLAEVMPGIIMSFLTDKLKTMEPLIVFRVKLHPQRGIETLVLAAHEEGTRETGAVEDAAGFLADHRGMILTVLAVAALVALVVRRRRRRRPVD